MPKDLRCCGIWVCRSASKEILDGNYCKDRKRSKEAGSYRAGQKGWGRCEVPDPPAQPLQKLRQAARVSPQVFPVPHLLPRICSVRRDPWYHQGELVSKNRVSGPEQWRRAAIENL